jgi:hypothetical protein
MTKQTFIEYFKNKLDSKEFVLPVDLLKIGLYSSKAEIRTALRKGVFPSLRVSRNRVLIPVAAILKHLEASVNENK